MMKFSTYRLGLFSMAVLLLISFGMSACDNTIDPYETEVGLYSVYGGLDLNSEKNYIRVMDLSTPLDSQNSELGAVVEFVNLNTGLTEILDDTLVQFDGVNTFNFIKEGEIFPKTDYRVRVTNPEGSFREVDTQTPPKANHTVEGENRHCGLPVTITLDDVGEDDTILWYVRFEYDDRNFETALQFFRVPERTDSGGLEYQFRPQQVLDPIFGENIVQCYQLSDNKFYVEYIHHGPGYVTGSSDPDDPVVTSRLLGFYREMETVVVDTTCSSYQRCIAGF